MRPSTALGQTRWKSIYNLLRSDAVWGLEPTSFFTMCVDKICVIIKKKWADEVTVVEEALSKLPKVRPISLKHAQKFVKNVFSCKLTKVSYLTKLWLPLLFPLEYRIRTSE